MKTMIKAATPLFSHIKISALALLLLISMNGYCKTESAMTMEKKNGYTIYTISYPNKKFYLSWIRITSYNVCYTKLLRLWGLYGR